LSPSIKFVTAHRIFSVLAYEHFEAHDASPRRAAEAGVVDPRAMTIMADAPRAVEITPMSMSLEEARRVLKAGPQPGADAYVRYSTAAAVIYMNHEKRSGRVTTDAKPQGKMRRKLTKAEWRDVLGLLLDAQAEVRKFIAKLPPSNPLTESPGNVSMMGADWPVTEPMARMSLGQGAGVLMQRQIAKDAQWSRRSLQAINEHNRRKWRTGR
jgi:hypothetical protein